MSTQNHGETIAVTHKEFMEIADKMLNGYWDAVQKLTKKQKTSERCQALMQEHYYGPIAKYAIVLSQKPEHEREDIVRFVELWCLDWYDKDDQRRVFTGGNVGGIYCDSFGRPRMMLPERNEWDHLESYNNGYREVWVNRMARLVLTICEGDLSIVMCKTVEAYGAELTEAAEFYAKYA
ncbi:hypothetical protein ACP26L_36585 (plasmid) [Paenibacillus sp. S-38]|uniref:hypothetical protein n=1 Tax=Paenibacillus sp. S-38 TaxID=3416710 RepID=UPI003CF4ECD8